MFNTFSAAFDFVQSSGYFIIFIIMILEGPIITAAAAFAASLGYFNIYLIFILAIFGNLIGDIFHYYMGYFLGGSAVQKYRKRHHLNERIIKKLETKIHNHFWKTMILIKMTPPLSTPGLLLIGASRVRFVRYLLASIVIILPITAFYTLLGYYFGFAIKPVMGYLKIGEYTLFVIIIIFALVYLLYRIIYKKYLKE
jgi:membrane protein DedA with SNARE-associated domain